MLTQPEMSRQHSQHSEHDSTETVQEAASADRISYGSAHGSSQPGDRRPDTSSRITVAQHMGQASPETIREVLHCRSDSVVSTGRADTGLHLMQHGQPRHID